MKTNKYKGNLASVAGIQRQLILTQILAPSTQALFEMFPLKKSMQGLNLGCGTGENTLQLKAFIGSEGKMTGIDSNRQHIKIAQEKAIQNNEYDVEFRHQNILEWQESQCYDFAYSRHFFYQLSDPLNLLKQVFKSLKPGGLAMIEDLDFSELQCFPSSFAFDRFIELYTEAIKLQGADPNICKQLFPLFKQAGFKNCQVQLVRPKFLKGKNKHIASLTLESISTILVQENLATRTELQALVFELKDFESHKDTMITMPGIYQVWGAR